MPPSSGTRVTALVLVLAMLGCLAIIFTHRSDPVFGSGPAIGRFATPVVMYDVPPDAAVRNGRRIVITGGAGFIGSQLGHYLHQKGFDVTLIDNMAFGYDDNLVVDGRRFGRFVMGDVLDANIWPFLQDAEAVFHFAALSALPVCQSNPRQAMDVNVAGTANVLEGARLHNVGRFIFASTSAVYENNKEPVFTEDLAVSPHLLYSLSKQQSEQLVRGMAETYGLDTVILRFFNVYGPHQDFRRKSPPFTSYIVRELINGRAPILHSDGKQRRDYVFITDLLELAFLAMTRREALGQTINVASGVAYSVNDMFDIVARALQSDLRPVYRPAAGFWKAYPEMFEGDHPIKVSILEKEVNKVVVGSRAKAKELLGWEPKVSMEEGLRQMVQYVRSTQLTKGDFETAWGAAPPTPR